MRTFSIQTITALVEVVTGGSGMSPGSRHVGRYRSGPELEVFLGSAGLELRIGSGSRVPTVRAVLMAASRTGDGREAIVRLMEQVADPREYIDNPSQQEDVLQYLNARLRGDRCEIKPVGERCRLLPIGSEGAVAPALRKEAAALGMESVQRDLNQALAEADTNPEGAVTAACSTVESVCKCILDELRQPPPSRQDISGLARAVCEHLRLSPDQEGLPQDIRQMLGGLSTVVGGIGALRTHVGDAHGRGKVRPLVDGRVARFAINAASTVSLFYIETWRSQQSKKAVK